MADAAALATAFGRVLRGAGVAAPVDSVLTFTEALDAVGVTAREPVYWAGRATLVHRPEDVAVYDRAFAVFWERHAAGLAPFPRPEQSATVALDDAPADDGADSPDDADGDDEPDLTLRFSRTEVLRRRDFAAYDEGELHEAQQLMRGLRLAGSRRRSRRLVRSRRARGRVDLRRTVRIALRAEGEAVRTLRLQQGTRARRLVLLIDISGSMETYARALLRFVHAAVVGRQKVEAFAIGTRLTRMTRELASRDPDVALRQAGERVLDWSGGTRLGDGLRQFNDEWGVRGMARGAIVVILSDGWDRGDAAVLGEQMARLARVAHRIIWVNPLKVTPGYAPLARGMAAALPYVDAFVEGHSLDALERLADEISR